LIETKNVSFDSFSGLMKVLMLNVLEVSPGANPRISFTIS
jgi:hypothetical protein